MNELNKYTEEAIDFGVGTSNGWGYDLFEGGYIKPSYILTDLQRAKKLEDAIALLMEWQVELQDDGLLNEF